MRLESLLFAGYERLGSGGVSGFVRLITPQGESVRLHSSHPSFPIPSPLHPHPQPLASSSLDCSPAVSLPQPPGSGLIEAVAPPAAVFPADAQRAPPDEVLQHTSTTAAAEAGLSGPPESFIVEFLSSSADSSATQSRVTSSPPSPTPEVAATKDEALGHVPAFPSDTRGSEVDMLNEHSCELKKNMMIASPGNSMMSTFVHGTELTASAASLAELDDALTKCALNLFGGRLPQPPSPSPGPTEASSEWSEAVHYHNAVFLGYDDAGFAYIDAQAFAQRVASPQEWRLCPLPLLVCVPEKLAHFYRRVEPTDKSGKEGHAAGACDSAIRYPVLSRTVVTGIVGGSRELGNARAGCDEMTRATAPLSPASSSSSTSTLAYLSLPLRWKLSACGHAPALDLQHLFQVRPNCVYQLTQPREEVVFLGVALGVPWVRSVIVAAEDGSVGPHAAASSMPWPTVQPPAGYHWKDARAWAEPLVGCHDAHDIRGRYGLVDRALAATEGSLAAAVSGADGSASLSVLPSAVVAAPPKGPCRQAPSLCDCEVEDRNTRASLSPPPSLPSPKPVAATVPLFVKKGTRVFVPGCFGVMLECSTKAALMEAQFGVVHGDRLVSRTRLARATPAPLLGTPMSGRATTPPRPPGPFTVMGFQGRNVLVLLADGREQVAVQIHVTHGVAEVAETFRKLEGTPLPPPALPLEPLSVSASSPAESAMAPGAEEKDSPEKQQPCMPRPVTSIPGREPETVITPAALAAAEAPLVSDDVTETQSAELVLGEAGITTQVVDKDCDVAHRPTKGGDGVADFGEAAEVTVHIPSFALVEDSQAALSGIACVPHAGRSSSTASSTVPTTQGQLELVGETRTTSPGPFSTAAGTPSAHTLDRTVGVVGAWSTTTPPLLELAEEVTVLPAVTSTTDDAPPLRSVSTAGRAETPLNGTGVFEGQAAGPVIEAQGTNRPGERDACLPSDEAVSANVQSHKHSQQEQVLGTHLDAAVEEREPRRQPIRSFSEHLSSDHTPSVIPTPSSSTTHPSQGQQVGSAQKVLSDAEGHFDDNMADDLCLRAAQGSDLEQRVQSASRAHTNNGGEAVVACDLPNLLVLPKLHSNLNPALPSPHNPIRAAEEMASTMTTARWSESPAVGLLHSHCARQSVGCGTQLRERSPPSPAHSVGGSRMSYSPPPALPADCRPAPQSGNGQVMSYPASTSMPCATATAVAPTPFTNFLKAYAIYVLRTHTTLSDDGDGGGDGDDASKQYCNGMASFTNGCAGKTGKSWLCAVRLADMLDFYREQPLTRITEATKIQRRCRATWRDAMIFNPAFPASPVEGDVQVAKFKASASTTVFEELCVDELVSLLSIVHRPAREAR
ncbi:hypothetical protein JKF63_07021 [Porcisia hertigi]|uniref:Uncharacterized protein n=1 Tax=Porcisia hertigi TaxID=2761500 RepID=A0A836LHD8_9TRYP|nr:hypothetical protein JKF63_07021 [Porcisia hertigi]